MTTIKQFAAKHSACDRVAKPVFSSDWSANIVVSEFDNKQTEAVNSDAIIVDTTTSLTVNGTSDGSNETQILKLYRGQASTILQDYTGPIYYIIGNNLYPFEWCFYPKLTYFKESDRYVLTCHANLLVNAGGSVYTIGGSVNFGGTGTGTRYSIVYPFDPDTEELKDNLIVATLYSVGQIVTFNKVGEEENTVVSYPIFSPPVVLEIGTGEAVIDVFIGGAGGGGTDCRIPYYVE
jgi:hypothetical protein